jgi:acetyltransferase-like isoleucine patch superfamily enzyme
MMFPATFKAVSGVCLVFCTALSASASEPSPNWTGTINVDATADIHRSVVLEGKVTVGAFTKIGAGAVISGNVTIGHRFA